MGQHDRASHAEEPRTTECTHVRTTRSVTAGLERVVCEQCGHVSIRYLEDTVRIWPQAPVPDPLDEEGSNLVVDLTNQISFGSKTCESCKSTAAYYTPRGPACAEHAWEEASAQASTDTDLWIPLLIQS